MTDRFSICLPFVLAQECPFPSDWANPKNFSNDRHDPGGKTFCGITQREYDTWRKAWGQEVEDVRKLTQLDGEKIYYESYWLPDCPGLALGLDLCFFDASVNQGSHEAIKILQEALQIEADGMFGPETVEALCEVKSLSTLIKAFSARRGVVYRMSKGFPYFGKDWLRRTAEIESAALAMLDAPSS